MTPRTNRDAGVRWCVAASMVLVSIAGWTPSVAAQSPAMVPNYSGGLHPTVHVDDGKSAWMILGASFASAHKGGTIKVSYKLEPGFRVEVHEDCAPQVTRVPPGGVAAPTVVELRPGAGAAAVVCSFDDATPAADLPVGSCRYWIDPGATFHRGVVRIQYTDLLADGYAWSVKNLGLQDLADCEEGAGGFELTVADFDSAALDMDALDDTGGVSPPDPPGLPQVTEVFERKPVKLLFVVDRSGSMRSSMCNPDVAYCNANRWDVVRKAVTAALETILPYAWTTPHAESDGMGGQTWYPADEFAVVPFNRVAVPPDGFSFFEWHPISDEPLDAEVSPESRIATLTTQLDAIEPSGSTSFGAGMIAREPDLEAVETVSGEDVPPEDRMQLVLLFTDGRQNRNPRLRFHDDLVQIFDTDELVGGRTYAAGAGDGVQICPFALSADEPGDGIWGELEAIADARCAGLHGEDIHLDTAVDAGGDVDTTMLQQFFVQVMHRALQGDKLELANRIVGVSRRGEQGYTGDVHSFYVGRQDPDFTLLISTRFTGWSPLARVVLWKDGVAFDALPSGQHNDPLPRLPNLTVREGRGYHVFHARPPLGQIDGQDLSFAGEWKIRLEHWEVSEMDYEILQTSDNTRLATEFQAFQPTPGVGQPLVVEALVTEGGQPVTTLGRSVTAVVSGPTTGLGNVMSASEMLVSGQLGPEDDPLSPAGQLAAEMLAGSERDLLLSAIASGQRRTVTLIHVADGLYRAELTPQVEGAYRVSFHLDGETPENGRITRAYRTVRRVPVVPDPDASALFINALGEYCGVVPQISPTYAESSGLAAAQSASPTAIALPPRPNFPGGCFQVTLRPADIQGNLVGPGKSDQLHIGSADAGMTYEVTDNLDGSYTIIVGYLTPPTGDPTLGLLGVTLPVDLTAVDDHLEGCEDCGCCCNPAKAVSRRGDTPRALGLVLGLALTLGLVVLGFRRRTMR